MLARLNTLLARLLIGLAVPLVLFAGVGLVAGVMIVRLIHALEWEGHTRKVIIQAYRLNQPLERMRSGIQNTQPPQPIVQSPAYRSGFATFKARVLELAREVDDYETQGARADQMLAVAEDLHLLLSRSPQPEGVATAAEDHLVEIETLISLVIDDEEGQLSHRRRVVERQTWLSAVVVSVAVALALLLTVILSVQSARSVTGPIRRLRQAAADLVAGHYRTVPVEGPSELADMVVLFNHMALTLTRRTSELQQQEERYRTYIGATAHILWTTNARGEVVGPMPTWQAYTGQTEEQIHGWGWFDAVHPDDRPAAERGWHAAVATRTAYETEFRLRSAAGEYRHFACRGVPILTAAGEVREWIGTCADITDGKHQEALRQAKEAAEASSQAKSEFLARMSHELRTPLNAVIGMSKMLSTQRFGPLNAKQADYLVDITRAGEHLLALINDILDLAKVEAGKLDVRADAFSLAQAVDSLISTLNPLAEAKGVALQVASEAGDGMLHTDEARLRQILYNLLSNAIKFTSAPGHVVVSWQWLNQADKAAPEVSEAQAGALRLWVKDTGIGIAPEYQELIWDEFRQIKSTPTQQGTGLGLALTRRLVALLGGSIWLESVPEQGSTFTFVIPRRLPGGAAPGVPVLDALDHRMCVLVIEDHPPTNKLLVDWLAGAGLAVCSSYDGETGLSEARRLHPDLVVLDVQLPRMDGWQVLAALQSDPATASIPVIIVTVADDRQPVSGMHAFLTKPLDRDHFLEIVRGLQPGLLTDKAATP